jgi:hypothetical protein
LRWGRVGESIGLAGAADAGVCGSIDAVRPQLERVGDGEGTAAEIALGWGEELKLLGVDAPMVVDTVFHSGEEVGPVDRFDDADAPVAGRGLRRPSRDHGRRLNC